MRDNEIEPIAQALHIARPDWPVQQLRTLMRSEPLLLARSAAEVFVALSWVAGDAASWTPYRVLDQGPWWKAIAAGNARRAEKTTTPSGALCSVCSQPEERCRQLWGGGSTDEKSGDHEYVSNDEARRLAEKVDPLERSYRIAELKRLVQGFGVIPDD